VQPIQDVGDGGVRVDGERGQGLDPAVLGVAFQEPGRAVLVGIEVVDDADQGPAWCGGDDGWLIQPGELGAGPGEVVGVGAEESQILGKAEDAAVELVVVGLLLGMRGFDVDELQPGLGLGARGPGPPVTDERPRQLTAGRARPS